MARTCLNGSIIKEQYGVEGAGEDTAFVVARGRMVHMGYVWHLFYEYVL